jgi:hypothetical protein
MLVSKIEDGEAKVSFKMVYIGLRQTAKTILKSGKKKVVPMLLLTTK